MGNQTLPRVAQWKDVLVALYRPRPGDWLPWSHAYFPTFAFDEYKVEDKIAFARVGDGYLALVSANSIRLIEKGNSAFRELRSSGGNNCWLCQMGSKKPDGGFGRFCDRVRALPTSIEPMSVRWTTLRGQRMEFSWTGPLLLDGKEQLINNFPHFDTPYARAPWPADKIDIHHNGQSLVLNFGQQEHPEV